MKGIDYPLNVSKIIFLSITLLIGVLVSTAAVGESKRALKLLEKGDFEKLEELLEKSIEKDSINAGANYVYSLLFLTSKYPGYSIDTSYYFINKAIEDLSFMDPKDVEDLEKIEISESHFHIQKLIVEKQAFQRAKGQHSIDDYNYFLARYSDASQTDSAIVFRNEIAFNDASKENTYEAYQEFIYTYPQAAQIDIAKEKYEERLYFTKTSDQRLESYKRFLRNNPKTPFRDDAELNIFEISTADNDLDSYMTFIEQYPESRFRRNALDQLYHTYKEHSSAKGFTNKFNILNEEDSLRQIANAEVGCLMPIFEMNSYGFSKLNGEKLIDFSYTKIKEEYYCGNIMEDFLEVEISSEKLIVSRLGGKIFIGEYSSVEDLGCGVLKIGRDGYFGAYHKSGFEIVDFNYQDVGLVANAFIKFKFNGKWGLRSFSNREILPPEYDDIFSEGRFVIIEDNGMFAVQNVENLSKAVDQKAPTLQFEYDDYELVYASQMLLFKDDLETVIDLDLKENIPLGRQNFYELYQGWMVKENGKFKMYDQIFYPLSQLEFEKVDFNKSRAALKYGDKWGIYNADASFPNKFDYDSVRFLSEQIGIIVQGDTTFAIFDNDSIVDISYSKETKLLKPSDLKTEEEDKYAQYLLTKTSKGIFKIFDIRGYKILDGKFNAVEALGREYLLVDKSGKKGLYHQSGKLALKIRYAAIGNYDKGYVSTLINGKFGIYNYKKNVFLSAKYQKAPKPFGNSYFIGTKGSALGLVNIENEDVTGYKFDEILDWNDSIALVKTEDEWRLYDIKNKLYVFDGISEYKVLRDDDTETILQITKDSKIGVLSNLHGEVVGATFNDIINIGSVENPVFFAEKYILEAGFYVVIYYDSRGKILRKQIFTEAEEYEKIYCG